MKKLMAILVALVLMVSLVACANGTSSSSPSSAPSSAPSASTAPSAAATTTEKEKPVIAFVPKVVGQPWWDYVQSGVEAWAKETGFEVKYQGPAEIDAAAQVQIMTDLVAQDIDILCFSPLDPAACENICKQARDKGIIVIATEASGMKNIDYDVEAGSEDGLGAFLMDQLATQMGESGKYVTMVGSMTQESQNNWADAGVKEQETKYPNMTLVDDKRVSSESDAEVAYQKTKELLKKYPDLKGILGTSSFDAPGAARAIEELGLAGKVFAISVALPSESRDFLKSGVLQAVGLWDPAKSAQVMLNLAVAMYNGTEVTSGMDLGIDGYNKVTITGTLVQGDAWIAITKDNVDSFTF